MCEWEAAGLILVLTGIISMVTAVSLPPHPVLTERMNYNGSMCWGRDAACVCMCMCVLGSRGLCGDQVGEGQCVCELALMPASVDIGTVCNMGKCSKHVLCTRVFVTNEEQKYL